MKLLKAFMPLGMVGAAAYVLHALLGPALWPAYDPMTMDLSTLTGEYAPNGGLLRALTNLNGACLVLLALGGLLRGWSAYHAATRLGYGVLLLMALLSAVGYGLFPLVGDKMEINFPNRMHLVTTVLVTLSTLLALYLLAYGYLKKEKCGLPGALSLTAALIMTAFGALNPLVLATGWPVLGLVERIGVFSMQAYVFALSWLHTFRPARMGLKS